MSSLEIGCQGPLRAFLDLFLFVPTQTLKVLLEVYDYEVITSERELMFFNRLKDFRIDDLTEGTLYPHVSMIHRDLFRISVAIFLCLVPGMWIKF